MDGHLRVRHATPRFARGMQAALTLCISGVLTACASPNTDLAGDVLRAEAEFQCGDTWDVQDVEQYDGSLGVSSGWVLAHQGLVGYHVTVGPFDRPRRIGAEIR